MKIEKVEVSKIGTQLVVDGSWITEDHEVLWFRTYGLVRLNNKFYLVVEPEYSGGFWNGVCIETKVAVELRKEFNSAVKNAPRGPKLCRVIEAAYNMNLW